MRTVLATVRHRTVIATRATAMLRVDAWHLGVITLIGACCLIPRATAQYQGDIDRWAAQDALDPPTAGAILFTGSSSIRRWEQMALDFAEYRVLQRGFGGAHFDHVNTYVNDIVLPYNATAIVVWAGTNDIASGADGNEVFADYQQFVTTVHGAQPNVDIFYLGIMPTPGRWENGPEETIANTSISNMAVGNAKLHYIDLPAHFHALNPPNDPAFTGLFVDDIHLNRQGYEFWTSIIRPEIEAVIAPNKVYTANPSTPQLGARLLFDFGPSNPIDGDHTVNPDAFGQHWNNWHAAEGEVAVNAGEHIGNLINDAGTATGIDLTITGGFLSNGKINGGLLAPDQTLLGDLAIATATEDYFFCSADNLVSGGNDDEITVIAGIRPDAFGQIFVDITLLQGAFAYINAMAVKVRQPGDWDGDATVNAIDALALLDCIAGPDQTPADVSCMAALDLEIDDDVDMGDVVKFQPMLN